MKLRLAVLAVVLCAVATPAFAQASGGVKIGVGFNTLSFDPQEAGDDVSSRTGIVIGGFVEAPITPMISIQPEILWKQGGAKIRSEDFDNETAEIHLNTVDIPILLKAKASSGSARPFFVIGPVFGFKTGDPKIVLGEEEEPIDDDVSSTDVSIAFGGGVNVGKVSFEARYNLGVKDIDKTDDSAKTRSFMILVGFSFR